jgi:hypothetical protein
MAWGVSVFIAMEEEKGTMALNIENVSLNKCINVFIIQPKTTRGLIKRLIIMLDASPSMEGSKFYIAKLLSERLARIASSIGINVEFYTFCRKIQRHKTGGEDLLEKIRSTKICPGTNIAEVIKLVNSFNSNDGIIILTDGRPSVGPKSLDSILKYVGFDKSKARQQERLVFTLIGNDANVELISGIAKYIGGVVYRISDGGSSDLANITLLAGLRPMIAKSIIIGIPAWAEVKVYGAKHKKLSNGWIEIDVLSKVVNDEPITIMLRSMLEDCNDSLTLPIISTVLATEGLRIIEKEIPQGYIEVRFRDMVRRDA